MPITRPWLSSSGPPELPGLIAASVWITFLIVKPLGEVSSRCLALTIPVVTVRSSPNGLPIATTGSPTWAWSESPSGEWVEAFAALHLQEREVVAGVHADDLSVDRLLVAESDRDLAGAVDDVLVGQDVAVLVEHESGAGRLAPLRLGQAERRLALLHHLGRG